MTAIEQAVDALQKARKVVFFTGAGISADSGIPTYREKLSGIWAGYDPRDLDTAKAFRENPALVWGWYLWRRLRVAQAKPNAAHLVIPRMINSERQVSVITQNIDDLHERAGSLNVVHLHGSLAMPKCFACHRPAVVSPSQSVVPDEGALIDPPRCQRCNGKLRPAVVWYGEDLPAQAWKTAVQLVKDCDLLVSVGTSGIVMPAAGLPDLALASGASVIHVNKVDVAMGEPREFMLMGAAAEVLSMLLERIETGGARKLEL
ncbi:MAG: NAD-dependent protein deacylase [Pseudomonas sp.]|uniref:NAD-dependent protein deacylase n=1 Tax=Pseudomonas mandelii TaxID=75612 RepID=A0ABY0VTA0_9PSED|nr:MULTISPECIES: NAD-dependent protein deacylase [Pseudomonas]MDO9330879.1 NAD-dependent protein deacylase [Pseudomonas sp.]TWS11152.1 NAD-dependent protein deacylase [Pseudomonas mandelii]SDU54503.1 NAD-dependent deacetylase [Pseudomonas mandelii]